MVDSEVWRLASRLFNTSPPEAVLAKLARSQDPDAQFLVAAVTDRTSRPQLVKALAALKSLVSRQFSRGQYVAAVREPRHLAAAIAVVTQQPAAPVEVNSYLIAILCDGSARSLAALAPTVRLRLAGDNYDIDSLADFAERFGRTPGTRRLAARLRAALVARVRASPAGGINKLIGVVAKAPSRFSLWLEPTEGHGGLDLLVNTPSGDWIQLTFHRDGKERFSQYGAKARGRLAAVKRVAELPAWIAATGVEWDWDHARWNTPLRGTAFARLRAWLAGRPIGFRSNAG